MAQPQTVWVPTVDDLKVKLCYICREEDRFDNPEDPPRAWTHPCACTLVAHESCLLQWIKSAQQSSSLNKNALKCPQCGVRYELESDNPLVLRALDALNTLLSNAGQAATIVGCVSLTVSFGFTIYVVATSYGAFAVKEFLGEEMYNLLLTDDPSKWPWHAFFHLPMIPLSLILSRTRLFDTFPLVPLLLTWSTTPPIDARLAAPSSPSLWGALTRGPAPPAGFAPALNWPPTPLMTMVLFPFVRGLYRRAFDRLTKWVMGTHGASPADGPMRRRIRRIVWALNEDGPAPLRVRLGANIQRPPGQGAPRQARGQNAPNGPRAPNANANHDAGANDIANAAADPAAEPGEDDPVAERTLHITAASVGRFVGGALLVPTISKHMGALLLRLSQHSAWLCAFLAVRGPHARGTAGTLPVRLQLFARPPASDAGLLRHIAGGLAAGLNILCGGTPTWNEHDPVWWRNAVGLGLFVFAKDCLGLWHSWLKKRELESRRVKSRSFAGVDISGLELINPPPGLTSGAQAGPA